MEQERSQKNTALFQQLKNLEDDWENYNTQARLRRRRSSTGSSDSIFTSLLTESSPRGLMSGLQHRTSSSPSHGLISKVKKSDHAVEIIRDRRVAINSGKLKGRQLLEAFEGASEVELKWENGDEIVCSECLDLVNQERGEGKLSIGSCSGSSLLSSEVNQTLEEAEKEADLKVGRVVGVSLRGSIVVGRSMHAMAWFAFLMTLFAVVLFLIACEGNEVDKVIRLVPT